MYSTLFNIDPDFFLLNVYINSNDLYIILKDNIPVKMCAIYGQGGNRPASFKH